MKTPATMTNVAPMPPAGSRANPLPDTSAEDAKKAAREKEKRDAFIKLANARLKKAKAAIIILRNLANKNNYSFTEQDRKVLNDTLVSHVAAVDTAFAEALAGKKVAATAEDENFFK